MAAGCIHANAKLFVGWKARQAPTKRLLTLFIQHTSASLIVQENADPQVRTDLDRWLSRLVKDGDPPVPAHSRVDRMICLRHVRSAVTPTQLSLPVRGGHMTLGTWQTIYVFEHRTLPATSARSHCTTSAVKSSVVL